MIISRTPYRVSFAGGSTDISDYYSKSYGAVTSFALDKYIYVIVKKKFDSKIKLNYSIIEEVIDIDNIKNEIIKAALQMTGIHKEIEISIIGDVPGRSGLGSSSSLSVGLLNALYKYKGIKLKAEELAQKACQLEIQILNKKMGKQDAYAAAYGGCNYFKFNANETVDVTPISLTAKQYSYLKKHMMLFFMDLYHDTEHILNTIIQKDSLQDKMKEQAFQIKDILLNGEDLIKIGYILDEAWNYKKQLSEIISNPIIDGYYKSVKENGAIGAKLLGAGGGGFLLVFCAENKKDLIRKALGGLNELDIGFSKVGSKIMRFN